MSRGPLSPSDHEWGPYFSLLLALPQSSVPKGLQSMDAVALGGPSPAPGEGPPPLLLRLPLPASEVALPEVEGWAGVAGEAGVVEGAEAGSGVEGEEAVAAAGS